MGFLFMICPTLSQVTIHAKKDEMCKTGLNQLMDLDLKVRKRRISPYMHF